MSVAMGMPYPDAPSVPALMATHTFATTLADKGVHPSTAQKMLGHSDIRMTLAIYTHATDDMQDAATAALERAFS
jgi:integrase